MKLCLVLISMLAAATADNPVFMTEGDDASDLPQCQESVLGILR